MSRPLRPEIPGGLFHIYARGNNQRPIYLDDRDRLVYLDLLGKTVQWTKWNCLSYCLMDNHMHLVVETPEPNLAAGMQQLHGQYARRFNDRYSTSGHLFGGRYGSVNITTDFQLAAVLRYLALNPIEVGLCRRPEEYAWSSHGDVVSGTPAEFMNVDRLHWYLGGFGGDPEAAYAELVAAGVWA